MTTETKNYRKGIFKMAWQFVKRNGFKLSEALKTAWANFRLKQAMFKGIAKFYYKKVDGSMREAYGTLQSKLIPSESKGGSRKSKTVQVYYDTEKQEYRSYKIANLIY